MKYAGQKLVSQRIDKAAKKAQYKSKPRLPGSKIGRLALAAKQAKIKKSIETIKAGIGITSSEVTDAQYDEAVEFLKEHSPADLTLLRKALLKS